MGGPEKDRFGRLLKVAYSLLGTGVLGDILGSLRSSMHGELSRQEEPDSGLDFPGGDGGPLVVVGESVQFHHTLLHLCSFSVLSFVLY